MTKLDKVPTGAYVKPYGTQWVRLLGPPQWEAESQQWRLQVQLRDGMKREYVVFTDEIDVAEDTPPAFTKKGLTRRARMLRGRAGDLLDLATRLDQLAEMATE